MSDRIRRCHRTSASQRSALIISVKSPEALNPEQHQKRQFQDRRSQVNTSLEKLTGLSNLMQMLNLN